MKIVISIFCLPYEIDELERVVSQLNSASKYLSNKNSWLLDIKLSVSDYLVNWKDSNLDISFFENKINDIKKTIDWAEVRIETSTEILGCVSQRRNTLIENKSSDYFIWLDTDIVFDERTLAYFEMAIESISDEYLIITPEIVKIWDNTWDCLVNENYINKPLNFHLECDPNIESGIKGNVSVVGIQNRISNQPRFKFAGGWFTCISGKLLNRIGIPKSFGHYGLEDMFIMWAAEKLVMTNAAKINQYKIKNLIVCENYKYRDYSKFINELKIIDRKEEFLQIATNNINLELSKVK